MKTGVCKSMFPKDRDRLFQKASSTELFRSAHDANGSISQIGSARKMILAQSIFEFIMNRTVQNGMRMKEDVVMFGDKFGE
jgi:hypothetical protein